MSCSNFLLITCRLIIQLRMHMRNVINQLYPEQNYYCHYIAFFRDFLKDMDIDNHESASDN